ncbi:MAG: cytochrome c, partial [Acidimicrobiia bacterium]|nr:cytochrome c [Acidimicrobiia bacterium]
MRAGTKLFDAMILAVEATEDEVVPDTTIDLGAVVIAIAVVSALIWVAYLLRTGRTAEPSPEETPPNQQPFISDDEMESTRLNRVLGAAVISAAVLAIAMPVYYFSEANRQAEAAEKQNERDIHEGERWYTNFSCVNCHGPVAGGGAAEFIEPRSKLTTAWSAPSLNDVFYRYSDDEVRFWIVYGRDGTPMPASGLEGGGGMTSQEVDQVMAYIRS